MTDIPRISVLAKELYVAMQNGVTCFYMPCAGRFNPTAYYFRSDTYERCTKQVKALIKAGLVEKCDEDWRGHSLRVKANVIDTVTAVKREEKKDG